MFMMSSAAKSQMRKKVKMIDNQKLHSFLQFLGLAMRARAVLTGDDVCIRAIRSGQAKLAFVAKDAGVNTAKKYKDKCMFYNVPLLSLFDKKTLGEGLGKVERTVVVVTNDGFAKR